jgi:hypothetical protein
MNRFKNNTPDGARVNVERRFSSGQSARLSSLNRSGGLAQSRSLLSENRVLNVTHCALKDRGGRDLPVTPVPPGAIAPRRFQMLAGRDVLVSLPAAPRPSNLERIDTRHLAETKMDALVALGEIVEGRFPKAL